MADAKEKPGGKSDRPTVEANVAMVTLELNCADERRLVNGVAKWAPGLMPGEPNEGMVSGKFIVAEPRLADFDDSAWDEPDNIRDVVGSGLTFAWYRFTIELPETVRGLPVAEAQVWFETCADDYGEIWVDCPEFTPEFRPANAIAANKLSAVKGYNTPNKILVTPSAQPGDKHVIACLAINGPLAQPIGGVFLRYARLEICQGMAKIPI